MKNGGGLACLFMILLLSGGASAIFIPATAEAAEHGGKAAAKPAEGEALPEYEYINLRPMILPIITERGLTQQVSLIVSLELPYGKMEEVEPMQPKLTDAYLQDLYGVLGAGGAMMRSGVIDIVAVKARLTAVTQKVLGAEKFNDVLLQVVQQRPM